MFEKIIIAIILVLTAIIIFTGCDKAEQVGEQIDNKAEQIEDAAESRFESIEDAIESKIDPIADTVESKLEQVEDAIDKIAILPDAVTNEPTTSLFIPDSIADNAVSTPYEQPVFITPEAAQQLALDHAGVAAADTVFDRTEREYENGVWHYEVEFRVGLTEYEYDIHAETGEILSFEKDR